MNIKFLIDKSIEEAYRKGFSEGLTIGFKTSSDDFEILQTKVKKWQRDISILKGAPGTESENSTRKWY